MSEAKKSSFSPLSATISVDRFADREEAATFAAVNVMSGRQFAASIEGDEYVISTLMPPAAVPQPEPEKVVA